MMRLDQEQLEDYWRDGFLFLACRFYESEVALMRSELPAIYAEQTPRNRLIRGMVRSVRGPHTCSEVFSCLARHPRVVEPAMQILGSRVYVHQFKINAKLPFSREVAPWHQEFKLWHESDGMPTPRALIAAVFLDEVT
jgi:ectoine hydroxylase